MTTTTKTFYFYTKIKFRKTLFDTLRNNYTGAVFQMNSAIKTFCNSEWFICVSPVLLHRRHKRNIYTFYHLSTVRLVSHFPHFARVCVCVRFDVGASAFSILKHDLMRKLYIQNKNKYGTITQSLQSHGKLKRHGIEWPPEVMIRWKQCDTFWWCWSTSYAHIVKYSVCLLNDSTVTIKLTIIAILPLNSYRVGRRTRLPNLWFCLEWKLNHTELTYLKSEWTLPKSETWYIYFDYSIRHETEIWVNSEVIVQIKV